MRCDKGISLCLFMALSQTKPDGACDHGTSLWTGSDSGKTLSHLSSSLHLANTAFPQRYPFCPLPGMRVVDLTELSSQVCEGYALLQARAQPAATLSVKCAERREGRRLPDQNWNKSTDPLVQSFVKKLQRSQRSKIQQRHKWKELGGAELDQKLCSK